MSVTSPTFVVLAALFAAVAVTFGLAILRGKRNPFLFAYLGGHVAFVYGLPIQEYSTRVSVEMLLAGHLLLLCFTVIALAVASGGVRSNDERPLQYAQRIPLGVVIAMCIAWLLVKAWLLLRYGPLAFAFLSAETREFGSLPLATWELLLNSFAGLLLPGAFALFVMRHALGHASGAAALGVVVVTFLAFVASGESPVGARRLILVLALLWLATAWLRHRLHFLAWLRGYWQPVTVALLVVLGLSTYYQSIRNNLANEAIAEDLLSGDGVRFLQGFARFLQPQLTTDGDVESAQFLRTGPLDFYLKVADTVLSKGRSSGGAATAFSLAIVVPKALYPGEKPVGDVDDVLHARFGLEPSRPFVSIDYSTSIAAIGIADFGAVGVLLAAMLVGGLFRAYWLGLKYLGRWPLVCVALTSGLMQLAISQEAGLTALLSTMRDVLLFAALYLPLHGLVSAARRLTVVAARRGPSRPLRPHDRAGRA